MRSYDFVMLKTEVYNFEFTKKWRDGSHTIDGVLIDGCGLRSLALPRQAQDKMLLQHMQKMGVA